MGKIIRDPIHNIIEIDDIALKLIDTPTFQRLRRIRQLGLNWFVYPNAEHSRFVHSIGVYHLAIRFIESLIENSKRRLGESTEILDQLYELKTPIQFSALLHDIGHGPFSHSLEIAINKLREINKIDYKLDHEAISRKIIKEDENISNILLEVGESLPENVCDILGKNQFKFPPIVSGVITSQFDADRMDYLLRDSHMTGVKYGLFDIDWLLRNTYIEKATAPKSVEGTYVIAIDTVKSINALYEYLIGRFNMYKNVYFHKVVKGFEYVIQSIFTRVLKEEMDLRGASYIKKLLDDTFTLEEYLMLDDFTVIGWFNEWYNTTTDDILKKLLEMFFMRRPFKVIDNIPTNERSDFAINVHRAYEELGIEKEYFYYEDQDETATYRKLVELDDDKDEIFVISKDGVHPLSGLKNNLISIGEPALIENIDRIYILEEVLEKLEGNKNE